MRQAQTRLHEQLDGVHWWFRGRQRIVGELLRRFVEVGDGWVLDAGCGTGGNLRFIAGRGYRVVGLELDAQMAEAARERSGCKVYRGGIEEGLSEVAEDVRAVLLLDVLEHIVDDAGALAAVRARLPADGRLVVTVPAFRRLWSYHDESFGHVRRYSPRELRRRLCEAGFEVVWLSCFNSALLPAAVAVRAVRSLFGNGEDRTDFWQPPDRLNDLLTGLLAAERHLIGRVALPLGLSLGAVAVKPSHGGPEPGRGD